MITDVLNGVLNCAYDGLDPKPGWAAVVPGDEVVLDECCDGQLWVRLNGLYPIYDRGECLIGWNASVEVGIVRCVSTIDDRGQAPSIGAIEEDTATMMDDVEALQKALTCCPQNIPYVDQSVLETWQPYGPETACAGGTWLVSLRLPDCGCA